MAIYNTYFSALGLQDSLGVLPNLGVLPGLGRLDDLGEYAFSPTSLFLNGEQGVWYDPSDLTPEKVSWRRNLLTYSQDFENAAWTKSNASILSNLALYSQDFDNAYWVKTGSTVTANTTTAPDGTTTADKFVASAVAGQHTVESAVVMTAGLVYTASVSAKADGLRYLTINSQGSTDQGACFDLQTGTLAIAAGSAVSATSITSSGSGWYRIEMTFTNSFGRLSFSIGNTATNGFHSYTGDGTSGILVWGAQLVPGSTAQTYTRSLATAAPIQFADPLGGTLADKLVENTANAVHLLQQAPSVTGGTTMTLSAYVKAAERTLARLDIAHSGVANYPTYFNLSNGTIASQSTGNTSTITALGDGWYRVTLSRVMGSTQTQAVLQLGPSNADYGPNSTATYTGDGVSGISVFGAQFEQASTASAYQRITDFSSDFLAAFPTHALYQESTGVTPVTALGQSVGLVLDKRLGGASNLGPELLGNPSFNSSANYSLLAGATISDGQLFIDNQSASRAEGLGNFLPSGKWLQVEMDIASTSGSVQVLLADAVGSLNIDAGIYSSTGVSRRYVYSAGTNGNFRIIRNTGATVINSISFREVPGNHAIQATSASRPTLQARSNLLTRTEEFDNAAWTKTLVTITPNAIAAPDGTTTADKIVSNATSGVMRIGPSSVPGATTGTYTMSCSLRQGEWRYACLVIYDGTNYVGATYVDLATGTILTKASTAGTASITNQGNDWYRVVLTATCVGNFSAAFSNVRMFSSNPTDYNTSAVGDGTSGIYIWGADLRLGTDAGTYQRVVTATDYADVGLPRNLTFDGVDDSLATAGNVDFATWTVGTRRNLLTVPTMFDDAAWVKLNATVTANTTTAPDGTTTADTMTTSGTAVTQRVHQATSLTGVSTFSVYVKANTAQFVQILQSADGNAYANFDVGTGVVGTRGSNATSSITSVGSGWYRCQMSATITTASNWMIYIAPSANAGYGDAFAATVASLFLWGAQLETGSTATAFQDVGTDKVTLFSGVTKLSDAARGVVAELSATAGNPGTFNVSAPLTAGSGNYDFASGGSLPFQQATSPSSYPAPITNILTGLGDIGGDRAILRLNGSVAQTNTADQGTGNFGSYVLFVGRRNNATLPFNGRLFQLVIRGAATDSVTVGNAERWVGQLTGVAL